MLRILLNAIRVGGGHDPLPRGAEVAAGSLSRRAGASSPAARCLRRTSCPTGALSEHRDAGVRRVTLDLARCVLLWPLRRGTRGPMQLPWDGEFELAARRRDDLRIEVVADGPAAAAAKLPPDPDCRCRARLLRDPPRARPVAAPSSPRRRLLQRLRLGTQRAPETPYTTSVVSGSTSSHRPVTPTGSWSPAR